MAQVSTAEVRLLLLLLLALMLNAEAQMKQPKNLRRKKREWILPPAKLLENTDYTKKEFIAKIRSDKDEDVTVEYYLSGPGADKPPFNIFVVDRNTGFVRVTSILDREKYPSYNLTGIAKYKNGTTAEDDIPLTITVLDKNDNAPYFEHQTGNITEASKAGTFVMQITGKDDDQAGTVNSKISYTIISQEPAGSGHMFTIDKNSGRLYVKEPTLDRESHDFYKLVVKGTDFGGALGGLMGTGTVEIAVLDINDNIPSLEKSEYTGSVDENVADVVVMRIKALDKDLEHTDNWLTVFTFAKGNEDNLFSIETNKETNEGILKLIKPVDFEEVQNLELSIIIENVAPFVEGSAILMEADVQAGEGGPLAAGGGVGAGQGTGITHGLDVGLNLGVNLGVDGGLDANLEGRVDEGLKLEAGFGSGIGVNTGAGIGLQPSVKPGPKLAKGYPIKIAVNNVQEGPEFIPKTKNVPVSEDPSEVSENDVLTVFTAIDPDTDKPADDVSYAKAFDPDNWFTIDEETAEIKLNKVPDRESPFVVNGTYMAKILAITKDMPMKTATGTIAIQVTDSNDHCPTLTTSHSILCSDKKTVYVTGFDEDVSPNAAPFTFRIMLDRTPGKWDVEVINETSVALHSRESLWPGSYELHVEVLDAQGLSCPANEIFTLDVCTCVETEDCIPRAATLRTRLSELSAPAIGLLLVAMSLLLFIPLLLLVCQCGGADTIFPEKFSDLPFDARESLISYHTEGRGEDKEVPLQSVPVMSGIQKKVEIAQASHFNTRAPKITETHQTTTLYDESVQRFQETSFTEVDNASRFSRKPFSHGADTATFSRQILVVQNTGALYEDIALPDDFLNDYYTQKAMCSVPVKDYLLVYDSEGQNSPTGSVSCCSLLESNNDLQFFNDMGSKFKTLAEICAPPTPEPKPSLKVAGALKSKTDFFEPAVKSKGESPGKSKDIDIKTEKVIFSTCVSKSSDSRGSTTSASSHTNVTSINDSSNVSHSATMSCQAETVVLQQQPFYYTTSPMLQPVHYVVQPLLQNTALPTDAAHGAHFPGLYVVSEPQSPSSGLVVSWPQISDSKLVVQSTESPQCPASSARPNSSHSPNLLLPGSPVDPVLVEGLAIIGPNPDGTYVLVRDKSGPGHTDRVDPNQFIVGISQTLETSGPQSSTKETIGLQSEKQDVPSSKELPIIHYTEEFQPECDNNYLVNTDKEEEPLIPSTSEDTNILDDNILNDSGEATSLKEGEEVRTTPDLSDVEGPEHKSSEVGSEPQSSELTENQRESDQDQDISPTERIVLNLGKKQDDCNVDDELSTIPNESSTETVNGYREKVTLDQKAILELQDHSEGDVHTKMDTAGDKISLITMIAILTNQGDVDQGNVQTQHSKSLNMAASEKKLRQAQDSSYKEDEDNTQQNISLRSSLDQNHVNASADCTIDKEKERTGEQSFNNWNDLHEDIKRQRAPNTSSQTENECISEDKDEEVLESEREDMSILSAQLKDQFLSDDNIHGETEENGIQEITSPFLNNINLSEDQDEQNNARENASVTSQVKDQLNPDDNITDEHKNNNSVEEYMSHNQRNDSIPYGQNEEFINKDPECMLSQAGEEDISEDSECDGAKRDTVKEEMSLVQRGKDNEIEDVCDTILEVEPKLLTNDGVSNEGRAHKGASPPQQAMSLSGEQDEDSESGSRGYWEDQSICSDNIHDGEEVEGNPSGRSSQVEEESQTCQRLVKDTQSIETEHLLGMVTSPKVTETEKLPCEIMAQHGENASVTSQVKDQLNPDDNITDEHKNNNSVEEYMSHNQRNDSIPYGQNEEFIHKDPECMLSQAGEEDISEDSECDGAKRDIVKEEMSLVQRGKDNEIEDVCDTILEVEPKILTNDSVSNEGRAHKGASPPQQEMRLSDEQDEDSESGSRGHWEDQSICSDKIYDGEEVEGNQSGRSSQVEEESQTYQLLVKDTQSIETEHLSEMMTSPKVSKTEKLPCEIMAQHGRQYVNSQARDKAQNNAERKYMLGIESVAKLESMNATSSEELRVSRVATGQVCMPCGDERASGSRLVSGQLAEGEQKKVHCKIEVTGITPHEDEHVDFAQEVCKAEVSFYSEGLDSNVSKATSQVSQASYSGNKVVDKTTSLELEIGSGAVERVEESVYMIGETEGVDPNTAGQPGLAQVSTPPDCKHGAEASCLVAK